MTTNLEKRLAKLEADAASPADALDGVTDAEWRALAYLRHELRHPPGAEITDAEWTAMQRAGVVP